MIDLDETLVHCIKNENIISDLDLEIEIENMKMEFSISLRPGC